MTTVSETCPKCGAKGVPIYTRKRGTNIEYECGSANVAARGFEQSATCIIRRVEIVQAYAAIDTVANTAILLQKSWKELESRTDGWPWYWLSYGEKCYAFATVTAFPVDESATLPPAGTRLEPHMDKERVWVAEDGTEMYVDDWIANVEKQSGDVICRFIARAWADAQSRFGQPK